MPIVTVLSHPTEDISLGIKKSSDCFLVSRCFFDTLLILYLSFYLILDLTLVQMKCLVFLG